MMKTMFCMVFVKFTSKNYAEKLSSTLLSNAIKWIRRIKFSHITVTLLTVSGKIYDR